ncbi:Nif3-like dinuclear metal center hexameric protein [Paraglaciecola aquimarina]|uniref:Nif3-like dinuclear metal center hexameric protein n=1 Tax=Paraglaciecola algarum TaxID=3050085 RepID=A0ABS9D3F4_9ALTE|nr:Nif3-like dinuclear metal center hexameric protein [Paraglaciecola sp. G1-23]MCF2946967.1 Nif3-like dinuclear metal center hexameric protein [Paraglaciecola sp. G1-23]
MSVTRTELLCFFEKLLSPNKIKDYCPNGLQVEGKQTISKVITGVSATQALIDHAVCVNADAIFVHHGYFWKGEDPCITGMKKKRIETLLAHNINLFAYHLPLDIHPELGNNAQLAKLLGINNLTGLEEGNPNSVAMRGEFSPSISADELTQRITLNLNRQPLHESSNKKQISTVAWCTGGGQGYIQQAADLGIDAFITGEVSEQTIHVAREMNIHFYAAGHHATERYGAKAVAEYVNQQLGLEASFVDIDNPA